jgi:hypothetical protein
MPGDVMGLTPVEVKREPLVRARLELAGVGRLRSTTTSFDVSIGSTVSLRCAIS